MRKTMILASLAAMMFMGVPAAEAMTNDTENSTIPYADVAGHWAEKQIEQLYIAGAVGQTDAFRPDDPVTLGELITLFVKAKGVEPVQSTQSSFADVPAGSWLSPYAEIAYRLGMVHGQKQGNRVYLNPNQTVQREAMVSILIRAMGQSGAVNQLKWSTTMQSLAKYEDGNDVKEDFQRPLVYALQNRLVSPYTDGTLKPQTTITRAEAATYAALHLLTSKAADQGALANGTAYREKLTVKTTAYSYPSNSSVLSYLEYPLRKGVVAVDPNVIPLGTHLYIDGYGYAVAADIGGAVKQRHVDLYLPTLSDAQRYGMKQGVNVYVLD
ncbi:S-layer homology domain-containing protein [Brevibacillus choshinensis]|uniref:S-layer homology domain-containing protein n=2 Tax=Brevibacillus choshinensis TaxID=54911 RepID=A0ABX7FJP8_BRECH|nr:S-layer homology domain-containing protein [Brevibacillus choshinensis]